MMSLEDETVGDKPTETVEELIQKVRKVNIGLQRQVVWNTHLQARRG